MQKETRQRTIAEAGNLVAGLPDTLKKAVDLAKEIGSSISLTARPLQEHGCYGWTPARMPTTCACGAKFMVDHALSCAKGGFTIVKDTTKSVTLTAALLTDVAHNVQIEPELQPVTSEGLAGASGNSQDGARLDIVASGVGGTDLKTFFDVQVFNPLAVSNRQANLLDIYKHHEAAKKQANDQRIREVEHATLTPLVFSATGGLGSQADIFYKRLQPCFCLRDGIISTATPFVGCIVA